MIAVPIVASTTKEALKDIREASKSADVIELRLDCIRNPDLEKLLDKGIRARPIITTARSKKEGGKTDISEYDRIKLIERAIESGTDFADIELSTSKRLLRRVMEKARKNKTKVIISFHNFEKTDKHEINKAYEQIKRLNPDVIKIAALANSIIDNVVMFDLIARAAKERKKVIAFCMGEKGEISRILCVPLGSFATFASLGKGKESAPGQLDVKTLKEIYRVNELKKPKIFGLVGNPVKQSKGVIIHNNAFKKYGLNNVYVNFLVNDLAEFVKGFGRFISGFSVTIPFKSEIIKFIDGVDAAAKNAGAVNTVINKNGRLIGYNTDVSGAVKAIESKMKMRDKKVLMIGAGGAARAIGYGVKEGGGKLVVINRTASKAKKLGNKLKCEYGGLDKLDKIDKADIIINATSVGMFPKSNETPINKESLKRIAKKGALVFDSVYNPRKTKLLKEAEKLGYNTADGYDMFINQAAQQFKLFTGRRLI